MEYERRGEKREGVSIYRFLHSPAAVLIYVYAIVYKTVEGGLHLLDVGEGMGSHGFFLPTKSKIICIYIYISKKN